MSSPPSPFDGPAHQLLAEFFIAKIAGQGHPPARGDEARTAEALADPLGKYPKPP